MPMDAFELDIAAPFGVTQKGSGSSAIGSIQYFEADPGPNWLKCDGRAYTPTSAPNLYNSIPSNLGPLTQFGSVGGITSGYVPRTVLAETSEAGIFLAGFPSNNVAEIPYSTGSVRTYTAGVGTNIYRMKKLNGMYFTMPDGVQRIARSPTGIGNTWTIMSMPGAGSGLSRDITYGNNLYVMCGVNGGLYSSPDAQTWTARTHPAPAFTLSGIAFGGGMFVAVGDSGYIISSSDGINWTERARNTGNYTGLVYGNGRFVTTGNGGGTRNNSISFNGIDWTPVNESPAGFSWTHIKFKAGMFLLTNVSPQFARSVDGVNWSLGPNLLLGNYNTISDVDIAEDGKFVACVYSGTDNAVIFHVGSVLSTPAIGSGLTQKGKSFTAYMRIA